VFGSTGPIDANNAQPAVLAAIGVSPDSIAQIVTRRRLAPFRDPGELAGVVAGTGAGRVRVGGKSIFTLRATARMRLANGQLSDLRRTVAATVKFLPNGEEQPPIQVLRWYDNTWTQ
jgi:general secretion pathway protein K